MSVVTSKDTGSAGIRNIEAREVAGKIDPVIADLYFDGFAKIADQV